MESKYSYKRKTELCQSNDIIECLFIETKIIRKVIIGVIYRPPATSIRLFNDHVKTLMDQLRNLHMPCYILGDNNVNLLNSTTHSDTADFLDIMYSGGFIPLITRPTRVTRHSATLIDHIFTNNLSDQYSSLQGVLVTEISDHYPIFHVSQSNAKSSQNEDFYITRKMSTKNFDSFHQKIGNFDWTVVSSSTTAEQAFDNFYKNFIHFFEQCFPIQKVKRHYSSRIPWLSESLKDLIKTKNQLYI